MFQKGHPRYGKGNLGQHLSEEHKQKLRNFWIGRKRSDRNRKNNSLAMKKRWVNGSIKPHKQPIEARIKGRLAKLGKKNPNWKGGRYTLALRIRDCFKMRQWRSDIFTKDNFTCQECGKRGGYLEAHHAPKSFSLILKEYNINTLDEAITCEELWSLNNGQTLCNNCHNLTKHGNTNM